jgi:hypothetical protein
MSFLRPIQCYHSLQIQSGRTVPLNKILGYVQRLYFGPFDLSFLIFILNMHVFVHIIIKVPIRNSHCSCRSIKK